MQLTSLYYAPEYGIHNGMNTGKGQAATPRLYTISITWVRNTFTRIQQVQDCAQPSLRKRFLGFPEK